MPVFYGVWIPKLGWLKRNGSPVAFEVKDVAKQTARRVGMGARVEYIDDSLAELEGYFLEEEKKGFINRLLRR